MVDSASLPTSAVLLMKQHDRPRINVMINFFIMSDLRLFFIVAPNVEIPVLVSIYQNIFHLKYVHIYYLVRINKLGE